MRGVRRRAAARATRIASGVTFGVVFVSFAPSQPRTARRPHRVRAASESRRRRMRTIAARAAARAVASEKRESQAAVKPRFGASARALERAVRAWDPE